MLEFDAELGCYWPSEENRKDFKHAHARIGAIDAALKHVTDFSYALQAGGWIGMWGQYLSKHFKLLDVFEPVPYLFEAASKNLEALGNVAVHRIALSSEAAKLQLTVETGGCTSACPSDHPKAKNRQTGIINVDAVRIDQLGLQSCGALFLDVERYELQVLEGAKETLRKFSPVITVEVLKSEDKKVQVWMQQHGYRLRERSFNDWIFTR